MSQFSETKGLFGERDESTNTTEYVPTAEAIEKRKGSDFTAGSELIEKPIQPGGGFTKEEIQTMRFAPPFAGMGAFPTLKSFPRPGLSEDEDDPFRAERLKRLAEDQGGVYSYTDKSVSNALDFSTLAKLGFSDNKIHVENALESQFGKGNFKVIEDTNAGFLDNRFFVSLKKEDGSFTPFTNPTQDILTMAQKYIPALGYEVVADVTAVGTSLLASSVATTLTAMIPGAGPVAAPIVGPLTLAYSLYITNQGVEAGRQYLQKELGLTKGEAEQFGGFLESVNRIVTDPKPLQAIKKLFNDPEADITSNEFKQELRGIVGKVVTFVPAVLDKITTRLSRTREALEKDGFVEKSEIFQSAIKAEDFADRTGLVNTMLPQRTMNKKINRLAGIIDQTSGKLSQMLRTQMQSAYQYLAKFRDNMGGGDFGQFRKNMASLGQVIKNIKEGKLTINPERLGVKLEELETLFLSFRTDEARGMYNLVFDKLKDSSFNLEGIRKFIVSKEIKDIEPVTKQKPGQKIDVAVKPPQVGEPKLQTVVDHLFALGRDSGGIRRLSKESVNKALQVLKKNHPEYAKYIDGHNIQIKTPAQLLHMYATILGNMSKAVFSRDVGTASNPQLAAFAQGLREEILNTIAKPIGGKIDVSKELKDANTFYKTTLDSISSPLQIAARVSSKTGGERTLIPSEMGLTGAAAGPTNRFFITAENIKFQEQYVNNALKGTGKKPPKDVLKQAFTDVLAYKIGGAGNVAQTKTETAQSVKQFLENYTPNEKSVLGLTPKNEKTILKDLEVISQLDNIKFAERYMLGSRITNTEVKNVFDNAINKTNAAEFAQDVDTMMSIIARMSAKEGKASLENLRSSMYDYIISKQSGVLKEITDKNAAFAQIGDLTINPRALNDLIEKLNSAGVFDKILNRKITLADGSKITEKENLLNVQNYVGVIQQAGADAGSALSGAQLIGELFTLDPTKFVSAVTRISAQGRVAKLFTNKKFADAITGLGKPRATTTAGKIRAELGQYFFGKGSVANITAQIALQLGTEYKRSEATTANQMENLNLDISDTKGLFEQTNEAIQ